MAGRCTALHPTMIHLAVGTAAEEGGTLGPRLTVGTIPAVTCTCPAAILRGSTAGRCMALHATMVRLVVGTAAALGPRLTVGTIPAVTCTCPEATLRGSTAGRCMALHATMVRLAVGTAAAGEGSTLGPRLTVGTIPAVTCTCPAAILRGSTAGRCTALHAAMVRLAVGTAVAGGGTLGPRLTIGTTLTVTCTCPAAILRESTTGRCTALHATMARLAVGTAAAGEGSTLGPRLTVGTTPVVTCTCPAAILRGSTAGRCTALHATMVRLAVGTAAAGGGALGPCLTVGTTPVVTCTCPAAILRGNTAGRCKALHATMVRLAVGTAAAGEGSTLGPRLTVGTTPAVTCTCPAAILRGSTTGRCTALHAAMVRLADGTEAAGGGTLGLRLTVGTTPAVTCTCPAAILRGTAAGRCTALHGTMARLAVGTAAAGEGSTLGFCLTVGTTPAVTCTCPAAILRGSTAGRCTALHATMVRLAVGTAAAGGGTLGPHLTAVTCTCPEAILRGSMAGRCTALHPTMVHLAVGTAAAGEGTLGPRLTVGTIPAVTCTCPAAILRGSTAGRCMALHAPWSASRSARRRLWAPASRSAPFRPSPAPVRQRF